MIYCMMHLDRIQHFMRYLIWTLFLVIIGTTACTRVPQYMQTLSEAERLVSTRPDSTLILLADIEPSDLGEDSLKALYYLVTAAAHKVKESPMLSDSLLQFSFEYYNAHDRDRYIQSGDLYALHLFWSGNATESLRLLDSLISLSDVSDRMMIQLLQSRIGVGGAMFDCEQNLGYIRQLMTLDSDSVQQPYYKYQLCENYQLSGHSDSALMVIDELIDYARANNLGEDGFTYIYEKIGILEELGRYQESNGLVDYVYGNAPGNSEIPYLHFWKALNYFNLGDFDRSATELAKADSCIAERTPAEKYYYRSFAGHLDELLEYRRTGILKLWQTAVTNNHQRELLNRMEYTQRETEKDALRHENRALTLKAQNERKTAIIIIVALATVIIGLMAAWNIQKRKRRMIEAEERAEALQKMVDEINATTQPSSGPESLRRAMLRQLGIMKMVAETPTEQNREMLKRISSIDGDTNGALVNWKSVYDIIDNLYSGFYSRLHDRYKDLLTEKEEQIIILMMAGFTTKEISVITMQTTATIYVRKSSIRKKLGVPEKEDIVAFLRQ